MPSSPIALDSIIMTLSLLIISAGILFMHLRLRTRASLFCMTTFGSLAAWLWSRRWVETQYQQFFHSEPSDSVSRNIQALNTYGTFDTFSDAISYTLLLLFCVSFLFAARSIAGPNPSSQRSPVLR